MKRRDPRARRSRHRAARGRARAARRRGREPVPEAVAEARRAEDEQRAVYDPWQPMNRGIFSFNDTLDRYVLEPVATGWDFVVPDPAQRGIANFFANARDAAPDRERPAPGQARQGRRRPRALRDQHHVRRARLLRSGRRARASRPATRTSGRRSASGASPPGPYLVLPFFGPSNPRDTAGLAVDTRRCLPSSTSFRGT